MMKFSKSFIVLFLQFAEVVAEIHNILLADALYQYTPLFPNFELSREQGPQHPIWQEYIAGLQCQPDNLEWTATVYERHYQEYVPNNLFGCFSYSVWSDRRVRLHFLNNPTIRCLSASQRDKRLKDLKRLFTDIKLTVDQPSNVVGGSWMYNIEAYRRLFPPDYLATAQVGEPEYPFMALWGQFLDYQGNIKSDLVGLLLACVQKQTTVDTLGDCFPFPVLRLEAPIGLFYDFYGVL